MAESGEEGSSRSAWQQRGNEFLARVGVLLPGVGIALILAAMGTELATWLGTDLMGFSKSPISPILIAIGTGLLVRNTIGVPSVYEAGLQLCLKRILRIGVALLGIRLSLGVVGAIGLSSLPIVLVCIATALVLVTLVGRAVGLPRRLATLIAVGTAICGNTAIVATGPVIGASEDETSYAVGCITLFGLVALVLYPFLAEGIFGDPHLAGYFLGTAIHDTAQVAGAGLLYLQQYGDAQALDTATVTKLVRNLFMIAVIPLMALLYHRGNDGADVARPTLSQMVPMFVFGFLGMVLLRTLGDLGSAPFGGLLSAAVWEDVIARTSSVSSWCLTVAMASVGLGTNLRRLRSLGPKPLLVGLVAALVVGGAGGAMIAVMRPMLLGAAS